MARFKLEIVRPECTGCELCTTDCADHFKMADDGYSTLIEGRREGDNDYKDLDEEGCARQAAENCPAACIHLYEGDNKLV